MSKRDVNTRKLLAAFDQFNGCVASGYQYFMDAESVARAPNATLATFAKLEMVKMCFEHAIKAVDRAMDTVRTIDDINATSSAGANVGNIVQFPNRGAAQ